MFKPLQVLLINPQKEEEKGEGLFCIANNVESTRMINKYTDYPLQSLKNRCNIKKNVRKKDLLDVYHILISFFLSRN